MVPPAKVVWYLPIILRLKLLLSIKEYVQNLKWHESVIIFFDTRLILHNGRGLMKFPEFGTKPRNLRLWLAIVGMNPCGNLSGKHDSWPVLLMI